MTPAAILMCLIVGVSDGDTITARCGDPGEYRQVKVRIAEIDAPEKNQPFGAASKQSLSDLCFDTRATIKAQTTDRYGRTVARVECNGHDASAHQITRGMAWVYDRYATDNSLRQAQQLAKQQGIGLWADKDPTPPWTWRRK